jgi:hypothetical protein
MNSQLLSSFLIDAAIAIAKTRPPRPFISFSAALAASFASRLWCSLVAGLASLPVTSLSAMISIVNSSEFSELAQVNRSVPVPVPYRYHFLDDSDDAFSLSSFADDG